MLRGHALVREIIVTFGEGFRNDGKFRGGESWGEGLGRGLGWVEFFLRDFGDILIENPQMLIVKKF